MALQSQSSSSLLPYPPHHQHKILSSTLFKPTSWNATTNKSFYHFVGSSAAAITVAGMQPKPKPILPETSTDYINQNPASEKIKGLCKQGKLHDALDAFDLIKRKKIQLDKEACNILLQECCAVKAVEDSRRIYGHMVDSGMELDESLGAKLVAMYARNGKLLNARQVFDKMPERDLGLWNRIIAGYVKHGRGDEALRVFCAMREEGMEMDGYTLAAILRACAAQAAIDAGKQVHVCVVKMETQRNVYVGSALVDMYAKCGRIDDARQVFDKMPGRNVVSWNAMIAGYAQHGRGKEALRLFCEMQKVSGMTADGFTLSTVLRVCVGLAALAQGKQVHAAVVRCEFELDIVLGSALVDLYSKWGRVEDARHVFERMPERNIITWNTMIAGYGSHGKGKEALHLFEQMQREGMKPNYITLSSILSACSSSGLGNEGWKYFDCMRRDYGITPSAVHYACMVEILGRSGQLDEAYEFIRKAPIRPNAYMWGALLCACRKHVNISLAEVAAQKLFELEPYNVGNYLVLLDMYVAAGRWDGVVNLKKMMKDKGLNSEPQCSWIEVKERAHVFFVGDRLHPLREEVYALLKRLTIQLEKIGYVPKASFVLPDMDRQQEELGSFHSEKLAIAFGLISMSSAKSIQIVQNHRICADCHTATELISMVVGREIVVRDLTCFHHFKGGLCTCGDYW